MQCSALYEIVLRHLAVSGFMVMACRWVTILRARHNRKFYGWSKEYDFLDQSRVRILFVVYGSGYNYGRPVETLLGSFQRLNIFICLIAAISYTKSSNNKLF
jgi:hypothetical protein